MNSLSTAEMRRMDDKRNTSELPVRYRVTVQPGEVYVAPKGVKEIRVLQGGAWVTFAGRDILLYSGQSRAFASGQDVALVEALHRTPVVLDVVGDLAAEERQQLKHAFYERMAQRQQLMDAEAHDEQWLQ